MAISSDKRKLFVTAPNNLIIVVNIDSKYRLISTNFNPRKWHEIIGTLRTSMGTEGIAATTDPHKMTFTIPLNDYQGFGVLEITNDDPTNFAATTRYVSLGLGSMLKSLPLHGIAQPHNETRLSLGNRSHKS